MNQKRAYGFLLLSLVLILGISFVSAGWWSKITGYALTEQKVNMTISANNKAPTIPYVSNNAISLNESTVENAVFYFTVFDNDKTSDINDSTANASFSRSGETTRVKSSCSKVGDIGAGNKTANFTCTVPMWYFDAPGLWNISVSISDKAGHSVSNISQTVNVNQLTGFVQSPTSLTFPIINASDYNTTANNDPLLLNNTGNANITSIQVNATDLKGEDDGNYALYANNFSVGTATGGNVECGASTMARYAFTSVSGAVLPRGNYTINDGRGQEQLYVCLKYAGDEITGQQYSTLSEGSWTVKIA